MRFQRPENGVNSGGKLSSLLVSRRSCSLASSPWLITARKPFGIFPIEHLAIITRRFKETVWLAFTILGKSQGRALSLRGDESDPKTNWLRFTTISFCKYDFFHKRLTSLDSCNFSLHSLSLSYKSLLPTIIPAIRDTIISTGQKDIKYKSFYE